VKPPPSQPEESAAKAVGAVINKPMLQATIQFFMLFSIVRKCAQRAGVSNR
jgi:hypothetical protein